MRGYSPRLTRPLGSSHRGNLARSCFHPWPPGNMRRFIPLSHWNSATKHFWILTLILQSAKEEVSPIGEMPRSGKASH